MHVFRLKVIDKIRQANRGSEKICKPTEYGNREHIRGTHFRSKEK